VSGGRRQARLRVITTIRAARVIWIEILFALSSGALGFDYREC
jgi:hypothetical protein